MSDFRPPPLGSRPRGRPGSLRSRLAFAGAAIATVALAADPVAGGMSSNGMQRIGALTLSSDTYGGLYSAAIDAANGYAYFGGKHGWLVKLDVKGALPVELGAAQGPSGQPTTTLIDVAAGYAYLVTSKIDRVSLGSGDAPPTYVDTLIPSGTGFAAVIDTSDPDPANHYAYLETQGSPDRVLKISLATFTEIGAATLDPGETSFRRGIIDTTHGYAYFVGPVAETAAPMVVKVALGSGSSPPSRVGGVQLDSVSHGMGSAVIDVARGYAYFGTYFGPNSVPATVYKVALGTGGTPPTLVDKVVLSAGTGAANGPDAAERELCSAVIDPQSGYAYFGTDHTYPAKIFQILLGNGDSAPEETGSLHLDGGTQAIGEPNGPDDGENVINHPSSWYGEVFLQSAVYDPARGYAYFGTDGYPGKIVKVQLSSSVADGGCGDGVVEAGEQCDDGDANGRAGDCCSASCELLPAGAPCTDDGNPCTTDVCGDAGECVHSIPADAGCRPARAGKAVIRLRHGRTPRTDSLAWKWLGDDAVAPSDLGDPRHGTSYALCVVESAPDAPKLVLHATAPADGGASKPSWSKSGKGYAYADKGAPGGLLAVSLKPGAGGKARMLVRGKGPNLHMPALGLATPVVVRLQRGGSTCWESRFSTAKGNDAAEFKAKSD